MKSKGVVFVQQLATMDEVKLFEASPDLNFLYVLTTGCGVCHALLPQIEEVFAEYPNIQTRQVNAADISELAGHLSIFTAPVLILFSDGKEILREARFVHIDEFDQKIAKIYKGFYS
ncbi:thiol-disulfide isomerase/thioredoxin [Planomicrobium koreense]|uniref:Thiol-disulfide isomerase/thioredoxin n=1 Tax=Planococcus koreensis TaxID=112331 RepID=A0A7W8FTH1_9BACL|nr:thioredoxin family protein [Planococcus koreensis]MBB5178732.1 thiol-disulfide isomerase/thioredoxin [Planococcus koreensis]